MTLDKITRRTFLRRAIFGLPLAALGTYVGVTGTDPSVRDEVSTEFTERLETEISKYGPLIAHRAVEITDDYSLMDKLPNAYFFAGVLGNLVGLEWAIRRDQKLPERDYSNKSFLEQYSLIGTRSKKFFNFFRDVIFPRQRKKSKGVFRTSLYSAIFSRFIDNYSTVQMAKQMQDPRFKEYGLDRLFIEANTRMDLHPKPNYWLKPDILAEELFWIFTANFSPYIGLGMGAAGPFYYYNNKRVSALIDTSFKIGDKLKTKIIEGYTHRQIVRYVQSLNAKNLK